jgi:transposase
MTGHERLRPASFAKMWNRCLDADPTNQILTAYVIKEELRRLLALHANGHGQDRALIRARLWRFYTWCAESNLPEAHRLAATIETWWPAIEAFLRTGITNARTEGTNRLAKDVSRRACGFRNTDNHQRRVRLHVTRHTRRSTAKFSQLPHES